METRAKVVELIFLNGDATGIVLCALDNWSGLCFKVPRNRLQEAKQRDELNDSGVYFLFSTDEAGRESLYIGQTTNICDRLLQHEKKKEWDTCLVFVSMGKQLSKGHLTYLESVLYQQAKAADRYSLLNKQEPNLTNIWEGEQISMDTFASNLKILCGVMGFPAFDPLTSPLEEQEIFYIEGSREAKASAVYTNAGMVVLKGSRMAHGETPSIGAGITNRRSQLIETGVVKDWLFTKDALFPSASTSVSVILGRQANGRIEWKKADGTKFGDCY